MDYTLLPLNNLPTFVIGDIHGDFEILKNHITSDKNIHDCNLIIAGDIGFGFYDIEIYHTQMNYLNQCLISKNIMLYLIRGNHDDPSYFIEHKIDRSNIRTLADYTVLQIDNTNILCVGGGVSIDRVPRKQRYEEKLYYMEKLFDGTQISDKEILQRVNKGYWEDEMPIFSEEALNNLNRDNIQIHYVITHTSPSFAFKQGLKGLEHWLKIDANLKEDLECERRTLSDIYLALTSNHHPLKEWIYGHFHEHHEEDYENVHFTALMNADYLWDVKAIKLI